MNILRSIEKELSYILNNADTCFILSGAGMGVSSGFKTFRDADGFWTQVINDKEISIPILELANPDDYIKFPDLAMNFYRERLKNYQNKKLSDDYTKLLSLAKKYQNGYFSITSNVDNSFLSTGFDQSRVYEIHGNLNYWQCTNYNCSRKHGTIKKFIGKDENVFNSEIWLCEHCNNVLRPNILMFKDFDFLPTLINKQRQNYEIFQEDTKFYSTVIIEIGAGCDIPSIRNESERLAFERKAKVIRINPNVTDDDLNNKDVISLNMSATDGINYLLKLINK